MRINVVFEDLQPQNVLTMFLFSMKHLYVLTMKITPGINIFFWILHGMKELRQAIFCMLEATFGDWLWPQLSCYSMFISLNSFVSEIYKKNQSLSF